MKRSENQNKFLKLLTEILENMEERKVSRKKFLTVKEVASYLGWSESQVYKLTSANVIPFYRPHGKTIFFKKVEIEEWIQSGRVETTDEFLEKALVRL